MIIKIKHDNHNEKFTDRKVLTMKIISLSIYYMVLTCPQRELYDHLLVYDEVANDKGRDLYESRERETDVPVTCEVASTHG